TSSSASLTDRRRKNSVHRSTKLTTNGSVSLEIELLSVRPEHCRRAPKKFSHRSGDAKNLPDLENPPRHIKMSRYYFTAHLDSGCRFRCALAGFHSSRTL